MSNTIWKAPSEIQKLLEAIKKNNHSPRLNQCSFDIVNQFVCKNLIC